MKPLNLEITIDDYSVMIRNQDTDLTTHISCESRLSALELVQAHLLKELFGITRYDDQ